MPAKKDDAAAPSQPVKAAACVVPECHRRPSKRGLCAAHWDTHRGLATGR